MTREIKALDKSNSMEITEEAFSAILEHLLERLIIIEEQLFEVAHGGTVEACSAWLNAQNQVRLTATALKEKGRSKR